MRKIELGNLMVERGGSVNPAKHPYEEFELFSIPAYERESPDRLLGVDIGSSKKLLEQGDVLLSRIVPHIRRCWIVPKRNGARQIGSGEWIIFRSGDVDQVYLRYYLLSDQFHQKFMRTVKGVGGSLLRADPKQVRRFKIPLPSLPVQRRIARRLDLIDALRRSWRAEVAAYGELGRSLFLEMFGDPFNNNTSFKTTKLKDLALTIQIGPFGSQLHKKEYVSGGVAVINPTHIHKNKIHPDPLFSITISKYLSLPQYHLLNGDIIIGRRGEMGRCAVVDLQPSRRLLCGTGSLYVRPDKQKTDPIYIQSALSSKSGVRYLTNEAKGVTMLNLNKTIIRNLTLPLPPLPLQKQFAARMAEIDRLRARAEAALAEADDLFGAVLQESFGC